MPRPKYQPAGNDWGARSSSKKLLFLACENSNSNPLSLPRSVAGGLHNSPRSAEMPRVVKVVNDFPIEEGKEHNLSAGCDTQFVWIDEWQRPQTHLNRTHRSCLSLSKYIECMGTRNLWESMSKFSSKRIDFFSTATVATSFASCNAGICCLAVCLP